MKKGAKNILIFSPSKSHAYRQIIKGTFDIFKKFDNNHEFNLIRIKNLFEFLKYKKGSKLIIYSPSIYNLLILFFGIFSAVKISYWLHEPFPFIFILKSNKPNYKKVFKSFFISYIYNPIIFILTDEIIVSSLNAEQLLFSNSFGILIKILNKKIRFIPLPLDEKAYQYKDLNKKNNIFILASLNKDKAIHNVIDTIKNYPELEFKILFTTKVFQKLNQTNLIRDLEKLKNVNFEIYEFLKDEMIYKSMAESKFIILPYRYVTQSAFMPSLIATGTIPIISNNIGFRDFCFEFSKHVILLNKEIKLSKQIELINHEEARKALLIYSEAYRKEVSDRFLDFLND